MNFGTGPAPHSLPFFPNLTSAMHARPSSVPPGHLVIDLQMLPPEGRQLSGHIESGVFHLEDGGPKAVSPLLYDIHVFREGDVLAVTGSISADFEMQCVRCLEPFTHRIAFDDYSAEEEIGENSASVDLTERLRDDILLALPGHPHCDESELTTRPCPAAGRFLPASSYSPLHPEDADEGDRSHLWDALNQLKIDTGSKN